MDASERPLRKEGEKVWCPDPRNVWQLGTIVEDAGTILHVVVSGTDEEQTLAREQVHPYDPTHALDLNNLSEMDNLHQAPLLDLLRRRYLSDKIYARDLLFRDHIFPQLFAQCDSVDIYGRYPHFHKSYLANISEHGKRETYRETSTIQLENASTLTELDSILVKPVSSDRKSSRKFKTTSSVEQCVLHSNPILEAFGNAKTIRNDNSSRFGKFIKIFYHSDGTINGASTSHFLLEKSRIVGCAESERNYHIFYQLCAGLSPEQKEKLSLLSANDYTYLNQGKCIQCPEINDKKDFKYVTEAMETIGISKETYFYIFTLVAVVLKLGNIVFKENAKFEAYCQDPLQVAELAEILQVKPSELDFALTKRTMSAGARGSVAEISLNATEAAKSRNGLAKDVFSKLFDWLVLQINKSTQNLASQTSAFGNIQQRTDDHVPNCPSTTQKFIGILDIFGFEILQSNSFEQLCINYANEMLQQQFNQHVFVYEQQVYVDEGIDFSRLEFKDNTPCLELIDKKPVGILPLLDEQALLGRRASDENFIKKLHQTHLNPTGSYYTKPRFTNDQFIIEHYAGKVTYSITGFLEKNDDSLHYDLVTLVHNSRLEFLRELFPLTLSGKKTSKSITHLGPSLTPLNTHGMRRLRKCSNKMTGTMTVGRKFRDQMAHLITELKATAPSYIRCVKPNNLRFPQGWNATLILDQLIYLGVMETVRIRRSGYPVRRFFREFYKRYEVLTRTGGTVREFVSSDKELCERILRFVERENWQLGHRKVFLRDGQLRLLDQRVRIMIEKAAITIQKCERGSRQRKRYRKTYALIVWTQAMLRMSLARRKFVRLYRRVTLLNALARAYLQQRRYQCIRKRVIMVQSCVRGRLARRYVWYLRNLPIASTKVGATFRMYWARKAYQSKRKAATMIASAARMWRERRLYRNKRDAARLIASRYKGFKAQTTYLCKKRAAVCLHAAGRGFLARLKYGKSARMRTLKQNSAQVQISRLTRGFLAQKRYRRTIRQITSIQACIRAYKVRTEYVKGRNATIKSQSMIRRGLVRRRFLLEKRMAIRIQAVFRMLAARQTYRKEYHHVVLCQSIARMKSVRATYRTLRLGLTRFQAVWRRFLQQARYKQMLWRICRVQAESRRMLERNRFLKAKAMAVYIQKWTRRYLAQQTFTKCRSKATLIQAFVRGSLERQWYHRTRHRVILLQSLARRAIGRHCAMQRRKAREVIVSVITGYLTRLLLKKKTQSLFHAAIEYDTAQVQALARELPNILRVRNQQMMSLVHIAARNCDQNLARLVLEENANMENLVHSKDALGNTPLHYACQLAHMDMIQLLATAANRISTPNSSSSGLSEYDQRASSATTEEIIDDPADVKTRMHLRIRDGLSSELSSPIACKNGENAPTKRRTRRMLISSTPTGNLQRSRSFPSQNALPMQVFKEGYLRKASGNRWATKRYVIVDQVCLSYYKSPKDKIPLRMVELCDAIIKRLSHVAYGFEIQSPRLLSSRNKEGVVSFVTDNDSIVLEWMVAIRKVKGVRVITNIPSNTNMIGIDGCSRREFVNMCNGSGLSSLHCAVQNDDDEGFEAVKVCVWLIEAGADINAVDGNGDTALHYAVSLDRYDLVETLMKKRAALDVKNSNGQTPSDLTQDDEMKELLHLYSTDHEPLLRCPFHLPDSTYIAVFLGAVAVATGPLMETPHFCLYTMDFRKSIVEKPQHTPTSLIQSGTNYWWFGNTWYLQHPLEHLMQGTVAVMELVHHNAVTNEEEVGCWTFFRLDLSNITSASITFEMYAPPVDPFSRILARIPGDSFLQADINVML
uniref:Myosinlike protein putative n=1 Tax=Albugo laibachii Nc14 TaxID=890382 RepID=F0W3L1_9STRA|nr:myosinlike protein putative [Albugo laibachii Nc14]|eukprot:CCA15654.1 myosinlike protein putative [Albugo laibachii Nc14]